MTTTTTPNTANAVRLRDGRALGYAEYGDLSGKPVLFFHGFPGSRLLGALMHSAAARHGVRIISIDRPGCGLSDFKQDRTFLDWPEDVVQMTAALGIDRFGVVGMSGGGPYAAVCAYAIPERLTGAYIISGNGPLDAPGATEGMSTQNRTLFALGRRAPWLGGLFIRLMARFAKHPSDTMLDRMTKGMPPPDRAVFARPEIRAILLSDLREAFRQGARGATHELRVYAKPWGFRLEDIRVPVHLWQGSVDQNVSPAMGRYQASAIENCKATFMEGEGHLLGITHADTIIAATAAK